MRVLWLPLGGQLINEDLASFSQFDSSVLVFGHKDGGGPAVPEIVATATTELDRGDKERLAIEMAQADGFDAVVVLDGSEPDAVSTVSPDQIVSVVRGNLFCSFTFAPPRALRRSLTSLWPLPVKMKAPIIVGFLASGNAVVRIYGHPFLDSNALMRLDADSFPLSIALLGLAAGKLMKAETLAVSKGGSSRMSFLKVARKLAMPILHSMGLMYDRELDADTSNVRYSLKLGYPSSHSLALAAQKKMVPIADLGSGPGQMALEFSKRAASVVAMDAEPPSIPLSSNITFERRNLNDLSTKVDLKGCEQVFLLDIIEHLHDPEAFLEWLHQNIEHENCEVVLTTGNIAFIVQRIMLLMGQFNYGRKGILDRTHTRLFTFRSLCRALRQSGFRVIEARGIPAPFPEAFGYNWASRMLIRLNCMGIWLLPTLFSFQIFVRAVLMPAMGQVQWSRRR